MGTLDEIKRGRRGPISSKKMKMIKASTYR